MFSAVCMNMCVCACVRMLWRRVGTAEGRLTRMGTLSAYPEKSTPSARFCVLGCYPVINLPRGEEDGSAGEVSSSAVSFP